MKNTYTSFVLLFICLFIFQLPVYHWLDRKIVSRRERPPSSEFGLVPIQLPPGTDDWKGEGSFCRQYCVDIVFVHGLGSNPDSTWRGKKAQTSAINGSIHESEIIGWAQQVDWITHLLPYDLHPKHIKSARMFYFNYDSYWLRDAVEVQLDDLATKLLVDLQSLKQSSENALIQARRLEKYALIAETVPGIIFLGTPHYGSDISRLGWAAATVLRMLGSNPYILDGLHYGSSLLLSMHNDFMRNFGASVSTVNFFEEHKTRFFRFGLLLWEEFVVRKHSATYDAQKTVNIGLRVDHKGLNKFSARSSEYKRVVAELNRLIQADREVHLSSRQEVVPKIQVSEYIDRPTLSNSLAQKMEVQNTGSSPPHCVLLHGLGGCGKTQLALSYIERHAERFSYIFWISAISMDAVVRSYRTIAEEVGLSVERWDASSPGATLNPMLVVRNVMRWIQGLEGSQAQWLIIVDELDSMEADPSEFIPRGKQGTLLVTSRRGSEYLKNRNNLSRGCQTLLVGTMEKTESIELLLSAVKYSSLSAPIAIFESAEKIAELLDYHPLALGLAYASTVQTAITEGPDRALDVYFQDFMNHRDLLLSDPRLSSLSRHDKTIQTTWDTSLSAIEAQNSNSTKLLSLLSHFHKDNIFFNFFRHASDTFNGDSRPFNSMFQELPGWLQDQLRHTKDGIWDSFSFRRALEPLISYSMVLPVSSAAGYGVRLHGLVQWRAQQIANKSDSLLPAVYVAAAASREIQSIGPSPLQRHLVSHLQHLNQSSYEEANSTQLPNFFKYRGMIYDIFASNYHQEGLLEEAKHAYFEAFIVSIYLNSSKSEKIYAPDWLDMTMKIALVHQHQDNWNASQGLLDIAKLLGEIWIKDGNRNETLQIILRTGITSRLQGRFEEAEKSLSVVKSEYERIYGRHSERSLEVLEELAGVYKEQGRWRETEKLFEEIEHIISGMSNGREVATVVHMSNKAEYLNRRGRTIRAEEVAASALERSKDLFGDLHDTTQILTGILAGIYANTDRCPQGLKLQESLLSARRARYGPEKAHTLLTMANLGAMYNRCGRTTDALHILDKTVNTFGKEISADHPISLRAKGMLVEVLIKQGDWERAAKIQSENVESSIKTLGENHPDTLRRMSALGTIYEQKNQLEKAGDLMEKTIKTSGKIIEDGDDLFQSLVQNYVRLNIKQKKPGTALIQLVNLSIIQKEAYGVTDSRTLMTLLQIGVAFMNVGGYGAEESFLIVEKFGIEAFEEGHSIPMMAVELLGKVYLRRRQWKQAYWRFRYLLDVRLRLYGEDHLDTIQSMADVGWTLLKMGFLPEAAEILERVLKVRKRGLPQHHHDLVLVQLDLGLLYASQNRIQEAEVMMMDVIYAAMVTHDSGAKSLAGSALAYLRTVGENNILVVNLSLLDRYIEEFRAEGYKYMTAKLEENAGLA